MQALQKADEEVYVCLQGTILTAQKQMNDSLPLCKACKVEGVRLAAVDFSCSLPCGVTKKKPARQNTKNAEGHTHTPTHIHTRTHTSSALHIFINHNQIYIHVYEMHIHTFCPYRLLFLS